MRAFFYSFSFMKNETNLTIKSWSIDDRPREKLLFKGRSALSDAELIAILIGSGSREDSAVELSKKILIKNDNDLNALSKCSVKDLISFNGIGEAKAIAIVAALELGRRRKELPASKKKSLTSSQNVFEFMHSIFIDLPHEEFWILTLNRANHPIKKHFISKGGLSQTIVDVKLISKQALDDFANSIILFHNHPSGNLTPSDSDKMITNKIKQAISLFDITLLDHLIFSDDNYYSFADEGLL